MDRRKIIVSLTAVLSLMILLILYLGSQRPSASRPLTGALPSSSSTPAPSEETGRTPRTIQTTESGNTVASNTGTLQPQHVAEQIGVYSNETYTDENLGLQIKASNFPNYAFDGFVREGDQSAPVSMTLGQTLTIYGYEITLKSITTQDTEHINGKVITSNYATLGITSD